MRALALVLALAASEPSREWCASEAATDGEVEACDDLYPDLYPDAVCSDLYWDGLVDDECKPINREEQP